MSKPYKTIEASPVSPALGAEISGIDIASGIDDRQFADLRQAHIDHGVIFLRDQDITPDQHIEFARRWGDINVNRFFQAVSTHPVIAEVRKEADQKANIGSSWHTDHSYDEVPAMGSILYAREVPSVGGDTLFASMYAAYDALSDGLKAMLSTMNAVHSSRHAFGEGAYVDTDLDDREDPTRKGSGSFPSRFGYTRDSRPLIDGQRSAERHRRSARSR